MKLYVCWGALPPSSHPCKAAADALKDAGHDPEIKRAYGSKMLPDMPFNQTPGRKHVKKLTGKSDVPVLELDDGTAISGSKEIVAWAKANPA